MVSNDQLQRFHRDGVLRLPAAVPSSAAEAMRDRLWGYLAAMHGRLRDDPSTWTPLEDRARFKTLRRTRAFDGLGTYLPPVLDDVLGPAWDRPEHWGKPLVTFPDPQRGWSVPSAGWHVDSTAWSVPDELPGVVAFTFLDVVEPQGGGTLVVAGSHHLTWRQCERAGGHQKTRAIKDALSRDPWFAGLWREDADDDRRVRLAREVATVDGVPVRVVELTGGPGDVVVMNQRCLHVAAPNASSRPRMMLAEFVGTKAEP